MDLGESEECTLKFKYSTYIDKKLLLCIGLETSPLKLFHTIKYSLSLCIDCCIYCAITYGLYISVRDPQYRLAVTKYIESLQQTVRQFKYNNFYFRYTKHYHLWHLQI